MGAKLHRYKHSSFRKKRTWPRVLLGILCCAAVVGLGFFGAKLMSEQPPTEGPAPSGSSTPSGTPSEAPAPTQPTQPAEPEAPTPPADPVSGPIKGFYLPHTALRNTSTLPQQLKQAAEAGFTAVIFDVKDPMGQLYCRFTLPEAQKVNSFAPDAFTPEELTALFAQIREAGLMPVPRLFAFRDHAGARALPAARISHKDNAGWVWYDDNPNEGGRAWLNPYADEAHSYIIGLALELKTAGAACVMMDGVQFPYHTYSASFGSSSNVALGPEKVLTLFVDKAQKALGDCPVILSCSGLGALGVKTQEYGNNPLTFTPDIAAPQLFLSNLPKSIKLGETVIKNDPDAMEATVQTMVSQMALRIKVMDKERQTVLTPWLQTEGYSPEQISQELAGCKAGGAEGFILYHPQGQYSFSTLKGNL